MTTKPKEETVESPEPATEDSALDAPDAPAPAVPEFTPEQQEVINRAVADAKRKGREWMQTELAAEKERLAKEAREAQLLERQNFKELYEAREAELSELKEAAARTSMDADTDTLLDNAGISSPALRRIVKALPPDLETRAERIAEIQAAADEEAEARVAKRLHTPAPSKGGGAASGKKVADMNPTEKTELRKSIGDQAFSKRVQEETAASK